MPVGFLRHWINMFCQLKWNTSMWASERTLMLIIKEFSRKSSLCPLSHSYRLAFFCIMSHVFDPFSGQICEMVLNGLWYCCVAVQPHNIHSLCLDWDGNMSLWWPILVVQSQRPSGTLALRRVTLLWQRCCYFFQAIRDLQNISQPRQLAKYFQMMYDDDIWMIQTTVREVNTGAGWLSVS